MRRKITAGNWKMNLNVGEGVDLVTEIATGLEGGWSDGQMVKSAEILVAPSYLSLDRIRTHIDQQGWNEKIKLVAQDVHYEKNGAYTGKVSISMLKNLRIENCIVGHSEQRMLFHETNQMINQKVLGLLEQEISPILCIGETLEERKNGQLEKVLTEQMWEGLKGLVDADYDSLMVAYEPVWAIGTGVSASREEAESAHAFIRTLLTGIANRELANRIPILYGGSVKPDNAQSLFLSENIDGALIGGASLKSADFLSIHRSW